MFVNVLLYKMQFISFVYLMIIKMYDFCKVYCVENVNVVIILRYFYNCVVYVIKSIKMWQFSVLSFNFFSLFFWDNRV